MDRSACSNGSGAAAMETPGAADAFRAIAEIAGDIAFIVDCPSGDLRYISPAVEPLLGHSPAAFRQQLAGSDQPGPLRALCAGLPQRLARYAAGDTSRLRLVREWEMPTPSGPAVPVEVISTLILDADGAPVALAGMIRDQSARRALAAEQKRFASMLNHEFRTPLSTIDGAIQRLEATCGNADEATRQRYRKIGAAVDRLIGMLDEYLSPDRMAALGRSKPAAGIAPRQLLDEAAQLLQAAGRPVRMQADALPAALRGDPQGLRLAVKVLVDNALAFSPPGSEVALVGRAVANGVELAVADQGAGVPANDAARIFDKGFRGSNAAGIPGNGLGLYMARSVLEVHGGTIELVERPFGGAMFKIWLPTPVERGKVVDSHEPNRDNR
ncbi:PAS domain-containing sensor histidine kinase [Massilia solisilvae]|uniref:histidine kinase n=1 Tax=Massilia solisilvae TaxID=1811225 RepID=A0ABT2BP03_9BURK|nr:PAS domain-containing sensor histidine kinase [Massilia solisilvae]MCS0610205.1 PAS domain-containing sensor histidine kinase [Massilia solisilvae]